MPKLIMIVILLLGALRASAGNDLFYAGFSIGAQHSSSDPASKPFSEGGSIYLDYAVGKQFSLGVVTSIFLEQPNTAANLLTSFTYHFENTFDGFRIGIQTGGIIQPYSGDPIGIPSSMIRFAIGPLIGYDYRINRNISLLGDLSSYFIVGSPSGNCAQLMFGVRFRNI